MFTFVVIAWTQVGPLFLENSCLCQQILLFLSSVRFELTVATLRYLCIDDIYAFTMHASIHMTNEAQGSLSAILCEANF